MPSFRDVVMEILAGRSRGIALTEDSLDIDIDHLHGLASGSGQPPSAAQREGIWKQSSFDLLQGLEVSEEPMDTMPDELIEAFLPKN